MGMHYPCLTYHITHPVRIGNTTAPRENTFIIVSRKAIKCPCKTTSNIDHC